uniref:Reverse transcriptase Ty1/copia-type domain-containing protein n=1 Tax=Physcomitrium patens TaxID=3218 RepID=A0A2K1L4J7_PHYPA|nr:hypothetical protein PHYPA_003748 [Physcomitrium patens]
MLKLCLLTFYIGIEFNLILYARKKYFELQYHYIKERIKDDNIKITYIHTNKQQANIFTKPLEKVYF